MKTPTFTADRSFNVYRKRNEILAEIGFESYASYLSSPLWDSIRFQALQRLKKKCYSCGKKTSEQIHHTEYTEANLTGQSLDGLVFVCGKCHEHAEVSGNGNKKSLFQANFQLWKARSHRTAATPKKGKPKYRGMKLLCQNCQSGIYIGARQSKIDTCPFCKELLETPNEETMLSKGDYHRPNLAKPSSR